MGPVPENAGGQSGERCRYRAGKTPNVLLSTNKGPRLQPLRSGLRGRPGESAQCCVCPNPEPWGGSWPGVRAAHRPPGPRPPAWMAHVASFAPLRGPQVPSLLLSNCGSSSLRPLTRRPPRCSCTRCPQFTRLEFQTWPPNTCADSVECVKSGRVCW